ncbi:Peflin [Orchesella cincta]|uniref:Peflin n=1 Tax=Orchesella cincta TaxID=48709 RepID=A0A1D2MA18_ORCCI|nr:Peflin [Orchesella cincta]
MAYQPHPPHHQHHHDPQITAWFMAVDQDRSGRIQAHELQSALMSSNGRRFSDTACRLMIGMYDNGTKAIDINGFAQLFTYINQWIDTFKRFDSNGSGFIDQFELAKALKLMGYNFSPNFADIIVKKFGRLGTGLAVDEFILSCILIHNLTASFRQKDPHFQRVITSSN